MDREHGSVSTGPGGIVSESRRERSTALTYGSVADPDRLDPAVRTVPQRLQWAVPGLRLGVVDAGGGRLAADHTLELYLHTLRLYPGAQ